MDMRTLVIAMLVVCVAINLSMATLWWTRRVYPGFGYWVIGSSCRTLGGLLFVLRGYISPWLSIVLANGLLVAELMFNLLGLLRFRDRPLRIGWPVATLLSCVALLAWFTVVTPDTNLRVVCYSLYASLFRLWALTVLLSERPPYFGSADRLQAVVLIIMSLLDLGRAAYTGFFEMRLGDFMAAPSSQGLIILASLMAMLLLALSQIIMNMQRIEHDYVMAQQRLQQDITQREQAETALRDSENRVRAKLDSLLSPEGDIGALELTDVMDIPALQALLDDIYRLTPISMAILDLRGRVLVSTGWQDICTQFHRVNPLTARNCLESDTQLSQGIAPGAFKFYRCKNQMYDMATPIVVGGRHLGNLFLGQFFFNDEPPDREIFRAQAQRYGFDEAAYLAALERTPRWNRDTIQIAMTFYAHLVDLFSNLSYRNIQLARSMVEQQRAETALRESEQKYRFLTENMKDVVWILDAETLYFRYVSPSVQRLRGFSAEEVMASPMDEALTPEASELLRAMIQERVAELRSGRASWDQFYTNLVPQPCKDGSTVWTEVITRYLINPDTGRVEVHGVTRDISERRQAEAALRESEERFRLAFDNANTGMCLVDLQGRLLQVNAKMCAIFGYGKAELEAMTVNDLVIPEDTVISPHFIEAAVHGDFDSTTFEKRYRHRQGHLIYGLVSSSLVRDAQGQPLYFISQVLDISERKRLEAELREQAIRDPLTGLFNRRYLDETLPRELSRCQRGGQPLSVAMLDLDHFKDFNDSYGHEAGDIVLRAIGDLLQKSLRAGDIACRYGGEELTLILPGATRADVQPRMEDLRQAVADLHLHSRAGALPTITVSIGLTEAADTDTDAATLLLRADAALYRAKQQGRNCLVFLA